MECIWLAFADWWHWLIIVLVTRIRPLIILAAYSACDWYSPIDEIGWLLCLWLVFADWWHWLIIGRLTGIRSLMTLAVYWACDWYTLIDDIGWLSCSWLVLAHWWHWLIVVLAWLVLDDACWGVQVLNQVADEQSLIIAVGYMLRSSPAVIAAKQLMQQVSYCVTLQSQSNG